MSDFISKIQHKTYEKGEFSEERTRTLADTIELIKTFPWDHERTLTSVELTGPSITICDEDMNWLKVGLFFNGKFCLYYLDNKDHLYEYHAPTIDDACNVVKTFFDKQLDLQKFEKHFFNIGNLVHFVTNNFVYQVKFWRVLMLMHLMLFFGFVSLIANFAIFNHRIASNNDAASVLLNIAFPLVSVFFYIILYQMISSIIINRYNYLQISKGNSIFQFGYDKNSIDTYHKDDIKEVVVYQSRGSRNPNLIAVFEICFKDGSAVKFSNVLISASAFRSKFPDDLIKRGKKSLLSML